MIPPYAGPTVLHLGPLSFPIFGMLVATGVLVGHAVVLRLAREKNVDPDEMRTAAAWALGAGFFGAHAFDVLLYHHEKIAERGIVAIFQVWDGISSFGGFFGAIAGVSAYFAWRGRSWWTHADLLVQGLIVGWVFGRLGCTLTSDHMGYLSSAPLAFAYASGARHNVGFYELLYTAWVLVPATLLLRAREAARGYRPGSYVVVAVLLYAPARFALDFLRATDIAHSDPRYFGLTGAQYACLALFAAALIKRGQTSFPQSDEGA